MGMEYRSVILKTHACNKCNGIINRTYARFNDKIIIYNQCISCGWEIRSKMLRKHRRNENAR